MPVTNFIIYGSCLINTFQGPPFSVAYGTVGLVHHQALFEHYAG